VTIQQIGGAMRPKVLELLKAGAKLKPVSVSKGRFKGFNYLFDMPKAAPYETGDYGDNWTNFQRTDDYAASAYFYLDRPENNLPPLPALSERIADVSAVVQDKRADT
jgi:hypothetical protein